MVTLEPILVRVELREETVTLIFRVYERSDVQMMVKELPISAWRFMDYSKIKYMNVPVIDMDPDPEEDDEPEFHSASEPTFELGSF